MSSQDLVAIIVAVGAVIGAITALVTQTQKLIKLVPRTLQNAIIQVNTSLSIVSTCCYFHCTIQGSNVTVKLP